MNTRDRSEGIFTARDFRLADGTVMPEVAIAYETYGRLAPDGRNAVLLTHGYTSSHRMVDLDAVEGAEGSWSDFAGPGKAIDTNRLFVVASNMLGSSYGSTGPASVNPATGRPYGPDFPDVGLADIVAAQKALLDHLGVRHLVAVAGHSYGGFQAFQWGVSYPDFMSGLVPVISSPKGAGDRAGLDALVARLSSDPNWNGGHYYAHGGILGTMTALRVDTLKLYGIDAQLAAAFPDEAAREREIRRRARAWAEIYDAHSLIVLLRAAIRHDAMPELHRIKARVLYVLSRTDRIFPPSIAAGVMAALARGGVRADYVEIDTERGHAYAGPDAPKWAPRLAAFMDSLTG